MEQQTQSKRHKICLPLAIQFNVYIYYIVIYIYVTLILPNQSITHIYTIIII